MKTSSVAVVLGILFVAASPKSVAQYPEDALRLSVSDISVGARALGMGGAYTGIADDFTAIYWNPAGLVQTREFEISAGLGNLKLSNDATFFGQSSSLSNSSTTLNSAGFVYPVPTRRGGLTFAFGYNRNMDFSSALGFDGFNPGSSIVLSSVPLDSLKLPAPETQDRKQLLDNNAAYQLYLANIDTVYDVLFPLVIDSVNQRGKAFEENGVNNWSIAGAIDIARNLSVGATFTFISGSYGYSLNYVEDDTRNVYHYAAPYDFQRLMLDRTVDWKLTGYGLKVGMLYRYNDVARLGFTIKFPTIYTVNEHFNSDWQSSFKNGDEFPFSSNGSSEYDVHTPYVLKGGIALNTIGFTLGGDVEYTDWTQMEFENPSWNVAQLLKKRNTDIKSLFRATANLRAGAEYTLPGTDIRLRGGFAYQPSPYDGDASSFAHKYITGGVGFAVQGSVLIDIAFAHGYWDEIHDNYYEYGADYQPVSRTQERITTSNLLFTISYRF